MIGVIGGTAMGQALGALAGESVEVSTPFGAPSGPITLARVEGVQVALLARHGVGHHTPPSFVNYRANLWALKKLGVRRVLATTAVGSLQEHIQPGHLVIPDQIIDKTFRRASTFFEEIAVHVELASPVCPSLRESLLAAAPKVGTTVHPLGTYVCMEGPAFSTRAESELHRAWGAQLIGMTAMPEAKLAREAELCYALISLPTDYDCWRPHPANLSKMALLEEIRHNLEVGTRRAMGLIQAVLPQVERLHGEHCDCQRALESAIFTDLSLVGHGVKRRLELLLRRQLSAI